MTGAAASIKQVPPPTRMTEGEKTTWAKRNFPEPEISIWPPPSSSSAFGTLGWLQCFFWKFVNFVTAAFLSRHIWPGCCQSRESRLGSHYLPRDIEPFYCYIGQAIFSTFLPGVCLASGVSFPSLSTSQSGEVTNEVKNTLEQSC